MDDVKKALRKSADIIDPKIDEGTVLKIDVPNPKYVKGNGLPKSYTYAALYVAGAWYLTGIGALLETRYTTTLDLFRAISARPESTVSIALGFESIR